MVEVGDSVAVSAIYQPHLPIKWTSEKVWRVEEDDNKSHDHCSDGMSWRSHSPIKVSTHGNLKYLEREHNFSSGDSGHIERSRRSHAR